MPSPQAPVPGGPLAGELPGLKHRRPQLQAPLESDVHFTVLVRVPFPRGDFVDPLPIAWDAAKDRALWQILSQASRSSDIDWKELADDLEVSLPFLLQQAAWLYERQLSQVRAQMRKVGSAQTTTPAQAGSGGAMPGSHGMRRAGSGGAAPHLSRTSSTTTATQSRHIATPDLRERNRRSFRSSFPPALRSETAAKATAQVPSGPRHRIEALSNSSPSEKAEISSSEESSSSDSEAAAPRNLRSQILRQRPRFASQKAAVGRLAEDYGEEDDDDETPAFLPFSNPPNQATHDPSATLRHPSDLPPHPAHHHKHAHRRTLERIEAGASSASSGSSQAAAASPARGASGLQGQQRPPGPLSPRRAAELAGLSPRRRGTTREGSDGTPSMGSSFSDLDDASVTQSALEEALLSNMQHGGMASRMSTISQALRSRYL
ncbi:MAG: hypothetical protein M1819_006336 [Sarea resinae]|nr:MAG: hypothetical protein M1819_006336 [Sarea resinae]